jgi:hypothetical protein
MSHEDLVLATLYTQNGPVSVDKELAYANMDTARRFMATSNPQLREVGRLFIDYREMKDEEADNE